MQVQRLGVVDYDEAFELQKKLVQERIDGAIPDQLLLLEHPPTITYSFTGRGSENLIGDFAARGVAVHETDRGGNITFHGPGQLVGYPIIELVDRDLHKYLRRLEEVCIRVGRAFGVETDRVKGRTGTWIDNRKLAAIGVKARRWVTLHGFALNVTTDLSFFDLIVPCGIADAGVTSLERELGTAPTMEAVMDATVDAFAATLPAP
ncbi:MAG: lipoyl(octanoyl) transferase LipB [Proteobacteria bacterium]|nr:lipoyl(octanoyl) transferase LipB [Pseudomonadota bacterium]